MNENKSSLKINYWFLMAVAALILLSTAITTLLFTRASGILNKKIAETAAANRPADLEIVILNDKTCPDCFDISPILAQIEGENVKIGSRQIIDMDSEESKKLIEKFAIKKLPTFLISGELTRNSVLVKFFSQAGDITENTFVFRQTGGPFVDITTGKIKGRTNLVLLTDITCTECYDVTQHENILKKFGMQPTSKVVDVKSTEGKSLVNKYGIKMVPTFILTGEINQFPSFKPVWPDVGVIAYDGAYVFTKGVEFMGTYKNLATNKIVVPSSEPNQ